MITAQELIPIGVLRKAHGTRGEIVCHTTNDIIDEVEPSFVVLELDNLFVPFYLTDMRWKSDEDLLVTFEDYESEEKVTRLMGAKVYLHKRELPEDIEAPMQTTSLIGFEVRDNMRGMLGKIVDVDESTINTLLLLDNDFIFPAHEDLIEEIDEENKILYVNLPEGL